MILDGQAAARQERRWSEETQPQAVRAASSPIAAGGHDRRPGVTGVVRSFFAALQHGDGEDVARYVSAPLLARGRDISWQRLLGVSRIPERVAIMGAGMESARTWVVVQYHGPSTVLQAHFSLVGKQVIEDIVVGPVAG